VDETGLVTFKVDGVLPTVTVTNFTFDSGDNVVPFIFLLNAADLHGAVTSNLLEIGFVPNKRRV